MVWKKFKPGNTDYDADIHADDGRIAWSNN
jgi:hypothetical protein